MDNRGFSLVFVRKICRVFVCIALGLCFFEMPLQTVLLYGIIKQTKKLGEGSLKNGFFTF